MLHYWPIEYFKAEDYILTSSGNRISRNALILKPQGLEIPHGRVIIKELTSINCEFAPVVINKYTLICKGTKISPSSTISFPPESGTPIPLTVGSHCFIGENCVIESAVIGVGCFIGANSTLSSRTILKDFVFVEANSYVPPDMVLPPFSVIAGNPAKVIGEVAASITTIGTQNAVHRYKKFRPLKG
jgi:dynactin-5